jgi:hypothetical protein
MHTPGGYRVSLLADPASSEDVEVLGFRQAPETPPAPSASELPAVAAGLPPAAPPAPGPKPVMPVLKPAPQQPVPESGDRDD